MKDLTHASRVNAPFPDFIMAQQIVTLASTGFSKQGIARHFGVSLPTFNRWMEESEMLTEAFAQGRESERQSLHNAVYRKAMNGDTVCALFLLKARHGYREGQQEDQANRIAITFNLPGAMTADQYRTLEGVAVQKPKRGDDNAD